MCHFTPAGWSPVRMSSTASRTPRTGTAGTAVRREEVAVVAGLARATRRLQDAVAAELDVAPRIAAVPRDGVPVVAALTEPRLGDVVAAVLVWHSESQPSSESRFPSSQVSPSRRSRSVAAVLDLADELQPRPGTGFASSALLLQVRCTLPRRPPREQPPGDGRVPVVVPGLAIVPSTSTASRSPATIGTAWRRPAAHERVIAATQAHRES